MFNLPKRVDTPDADGASSRPASPFAPPSAAYRPPAGTLIAKGVKLEGEFASQGDVQIDGDVQGKISAGGTLTVGAEAAITADVTAESAVISGELNGNLTVAKDLVLHASARVKGDISAERISVESGAVIDGRVEVRPRPVELAAPVAEATQEISTRLEKNEGTV